MRILKNVVIILLNIVLINLLIIFAISFNLKNIVRDDLIKEVIKEEIIVKEFQPKDLEVTKNEEINQILNTPEVQELVDKYLDISFSTLMNDEVSSNIELEKDILKFFQENKAVIDEKIGVEITDEMIEKVEEQLDSKELSRVFEQSLNNAKNSMPKEVKIILQVYNYLISGMFKLIIISLISIILLVIAILQKSFYRWLGPLGISSLIGGFGVILMSLIVKIVVQASSDLTGFKLKSLIITGIIMALLGVVLIIIRKILDKNVAKEDVNELSKVSS